MTPYRLALRLTHAYFGAMTAATAALFSFDLFQVADEAVRQNIQNLYRLLDFLTGHFGVVEMVDYLYGDQKMFEGIERYKELGFYVLGPLFGGTALKILDAWGAQEQSVDRWYGFFIPPLANVTATLCFGWIFVYVVAFWPLLILVALKETLVLFAAMLPENGGDKIIGQVFLNVLIAISVGVIAIVLAW